MVAFSLKGPLIPLLKEILEGVVHSYAQLFFALNPVVGLVAMGVSFVRPEVGTTGLASVLLMQGLAWLAGQNRVLVHEGMFGFNALLLGLATASRYEWNATLGVLLVSGLLLLLTLTVWWNQHLGRHKLPYLTFPFLLTFWILVAGASSFESVRVCFPMESPVEPLTWLSQGGFAWMHELIHSFLRTLASIFFQDSVWAGLALALALLVHSRISLVLALMGYGLAYGWMVLAGGSTVHLTEYLVGGNFVFMAIALGGFYVVPSRSSFVLVALLTPVLALMLFAFQSWLGPVDLPPFTLAFSVLTVLVLFALQHGKEAGAKLQLVHLQYYSAEKTLYKSLVQARRLAHHGLARLGMPVWGEWVVSQGYKGPHTHLGLWSNALDFVVEDQEGRRCSGDGKKPEDYYCYNKPVLAPLDGYVVRLVNHVSDNRVGEMDLNHNWGNSIVIQHLNGLYTQMSHLRQNSFKVEPGQWVTKGQVLAACGNSGRSPEPHLHFQVQANADLGAPTVPYPFAYYLGGAGGRLSLKHWEIPAEGDSIRALDALGWLASAFAWKPGQIVRVQEEANPSQILDWQVHTDAYNRTYLYCAKSKSTLWFVHDGVMFWAYDFEGATKSVLHDFYLSIYRISLSTYTGEVRDSIPLPDFGPAWWRWMQDVFAPWWIFYESRYASRLVLEDVSGQIPGGIVEGEVTARVMGYAVRSNSFRLEIGSEGLQRLVLYRDSESLAYRCSVC